jgi:ATP synthase protein I
MAQAPEHSGNLSHVSARDEAAALDRRLAPAARKTRAYYETLSFSSAGIELGLSVVIGALMGRWLDGEVGVTPLFMILMTVVGFAAGVRAVVRAGKKANRAAEASK